MFLRYLDFCPDCFGYVGKWLDKKGRFRFSICDVIYWGTKIKTHILPNISRSTENQTMKFHQLIDYNVRNIFCRKSCRNERGRLVPGTLRFGHTIKENCIKV